MRNLLCVFVVVLLLSACSKERRPARVDEISTRNNTTKVQNKPKAVVNQRNKHATHRVQKGDTLYSIGFRYQIDSKFLAQINGIQAPYRIYPGQVLKLKSDQKKSYVTTQAVKVTPKVQAKTTPANPKIIHSKPVTKDKPKVTSADIKPKQNTQPKAVVKSPKTVQKPTQKPTQKLRKKVTPPTPKINQVGALKWSWPTQGKIRTTFLASNPARKGISISGKEGQAVKAAADGVVVYSGDGLLGYGELIIIKHSDQYLSAYGHNKKRLVKEGEAIKRGQRIAELGSTGTNVNNLHFEIRKNGKPVNPLNYVKP